FGVIWLVKYGATFTEEAVSRIIGDRVSAGLEVFLPLAFITLPALAVAWFLRHVSRVIIQNMSLAADAQLRGTIATTYRALVSEKQASDGELAITLQAL